MMILVRYLDGSYDMVMDHHLEDLITTSKIIGFERANKWVTIGIDPVRRGGSPYAGPERRMPAQDKPFDTSY